MKDDNKKVSTLGLVVTAVLTGFGAAIGVKVADKAADSAPKLIETGLNWLKGKLGGQSTPAGQE